MENTQKTLLLLSGIRLVFPRTVNKGTSGRRESIPTRERRISGICGPFLRLSTDDLRGEKRVRTNIHSPNRGAALLLRIYDEPVKAYLGLLARKLPSDRESRKGDRCPPPHAIKKVKPPSPRTKLHASHIRYASGPEEIMRPGKKKFFSWAGYLLSQNGEKNKCFRSFGGERGGGRREREQVWRILGGRGGGVT